MISLQALKYKILEYCIETIFYKFSFNFSYPKYSKLNHLPSPGEIFSEIFNIELPNIVYKTCKCIDTYDGDRRTQQDHISVMIGYLYKNGVYKKFKYTDTLPIGSCEFYIGSETFHMWRYLK